MAIDDHAARVSHTPQPGDQGRDHWWSDDNKDVGSMAPKEPPQPDRIDEVANGDENLLGRPATEVPCTPA